jgi:uncharacterized membrane protein
MNVPAQLPPPSNDPHAITSNDRLFAALCYFLFPWGSILVFLLDETKNRKYPRYHAMHAFGFMVAVFGVFFAFSIVYTVLTAISFGILGFCLFPIFFLPVLYQFYAIFQVLTGKSFVIPFVTDFMKSQGLLDI